VFLILEHCFPNFFARRSLWFRKVTTEPHILSHINIEWLDERHPKLKIIHPMTDVREILIYISNVINNLLHDLTLTKIIFAHLVGTGGVLVRYSKGHTK
jgi:hypothetical protein